MDPRLWNELIFKWFRGNHAILLVLRAVCPMFRDQLNQSRHWDFSLFYRMRCDERLLGWPGVPLAMARERRIERNVRNGSGTEWEYGEGHTGGFVFHVATRLVVDDPDCFETRVYTTTSSVPHIVIPNTTGIRDIMADRWMFFYVNVPTPHLCIYDCWELKEMPNSCIAGGVFHDLCISGHYFSYKLDATTYRIMSIEMRELRRVAVTTTDNMSLALCCNGTKYMIHFESGHDNRYISICDMMSGQILQTFVPGFVIMTASIVCDRYVTIEARDTNQFVGLNITTGRVDYSADTGYLFSVFRRHGDSQSHAIVIDSIWHCDAYIMSGRGQRRASRYYENLRSDESGALTFMSCMTQYVICKESRREIAIGSAAQNGNATFMYGVLAYTTGTQQQRVVRFDDDDESNNNNKKIKYT